MFYPRSVQALIDEFSKLPGIGLKTAQRLAFHLLGTDKKEALNFSKAINDAVSNINYCKICSNISEEEICTICSDYQRDKEVICVVQGIRDLYAIEKTRDFNGVYHVLNGAISPIDGIGPNDINIKSLIERIRDIEVKEIILATNPNVEGEATALYISKILRPLEIKVTRIAHGLPIGGDLEYADEITLSKSIDNRREI